MSQPNYWQVGTGDRGRDYTSRFLDHGLAFVGGQTYINRLLTSVKPGDRIIIRDGLKSVVAAGVVVNRENQHSGLVEATDDPRAWLRDLDGWDLPAYCFVDWRRLSEPIPTDGLTRGTIGRVKQTHIQELAERILLEGAPVPKQPEPGITKTVDDETIVTSLVALGLRPSSAEGVQAAFRCIRRLAKYYYDSRNWGDIREHETRTFLVIPLLLALGWSEQCIKIELPIPNTGRADIACFPHPFQGERDRCSLLVETKGFTQGLSFVEKQAAAYASGLPNCKTIVTTNGYCYKTFRRGESGFDLSRTHSYLNLLRPRDRYPLDPEHVDGCLETLAILLPN